MMLPQRLPPVSIWLISAIFIAVAILYPSLWPVLIIGLALWLVALSRSNHLSEVLLGSWLIGSAKYAAGMAWVLEADSLASYGISSEVNSNFSIIFVWLLGALVMGLGAMLAGGLLWLAKKYHSKYWPLWFPILFIAGELAASLAFSLYVLGPGSNINTNFSFGYAGYSLADIALLFPVVAGAGVYGLSFLMALLGLIVYYLITKRDYFRYVGLLALICGSLVFIYLWLPLRVPVNLEMNVIAIDTYFDQKFLKGTDSRALKQEQVVTAVLAALRQESDLVLLPEDSRFTAAFASATSALKFLIEAQPKTKLVVDSARINYDNESVVLRAFYYDLVANKVYTVDKQYLVPQGEYVTYLNAFLLRLTGQSALLAKMKNNQNYIPGELTDLLAVPESLPGILFCFGSADPQAVAQIKAQQKIPLVLHQMSHSKFVNPQLLWQQLDAMLRTQAIWNNATIISAGNMSPSKVYYPNGQILTGAEIFRDTYWRLVEYNL